MGNPSKETGNDDNADSEKNSYLRGQPVNASSIDVQNFVPIDVEDEIQPVIINRWPIVTVSVGNMEPLDLSQNRQSNTDMESDNASNQLQNSANASSSVCLSENVQALRTSSNRSKNGHGEASNIVARNIEPHVSTEDNKVKGPFPGLVNYGVNCYLNTLLQCLFMTPEFRDVVLSWTPETLLPGTFAYELKQLFVNLKESGNATLDLRNLINTVTWFSKYEQQDLLELWHIMLDNFECSFQNKVEWLNVRDLFEGLCMDYVKCLTCGTISKRIERFYELSLDVKVSDKIYNSIGESLAAYIQPELLSGCNQYKCEACGIKSNAEKGLAIVQLPYIMLLHLKRYEFTEMLRRKLNNQVTYPDYLNLEGFMQKNQLIMKQNSFEPEANNLRDTEGNYDYELYFVVLHLGSARTGHFSAYVKSLETQKWFLFNDRGVYEMTSDVWSHAFGENKHGVVDHLGCAYVLGYRQVNKNRNVTTVESVITPVRHEELEEDLHESKARKRSFDIELRAGISATVYCFLQDKYQPISNVVKVYCEINTTIRVLKYTAIIKFHLDFAAASHQYRIVKFNSVMNVIECSIDDEDLFVADFYNPVFALELNSSPDAFIPFTQAQLKLYQIDAFTGIVRSDIQLSMPNDTTTNQLLEMIFKQNNISYNITIIIDSMKDVAQVMPKNSDSALLYMNMTKSRYYVVDDAVIPKDIDFFKSDFAKIIRSMKSCVHVTLRFTKINKDNMHCAGFAPGKASAKRGIFYSWPSAAAKIDGYEHVGITVELNTTLSRLYNNVAHLIGVSEQFFDLYVFDVSHANFGAEKLKCGSMTLKNALSNPNLGSYTATYELRAIITFDISITVFLLDLNKSTEFEGKIKFQMQLPCTVGQCKKNAIMLFKKKLNVDLVYDRCRLRKLSHHGVTNVYDDFQSIDKFMASFEDPDFLFCLQNVPQGQKLCSKLPDSVHLFVGEYRPSINNLGPIRDIFLCENTKEEFIRALSLHSDIPKESLLINLTTMMLPCSLKEICPHLIDSWLSVQSRLYSWRNKVIYDGKVIFYQDTRKN